MFNHIPVDYKEIKSFTTKRGRFYYITPKIKYPSITTILGARPQPWLKEWEMRLGKAKAAKETKRCADRGEAVHLMAEKYLKNEENVHMGHLGEHRKLFNQLKIRFNKINNIRAQEVPLFSHKLKVAGRTDLIAEYDGTLSTIDFKTSNKNKTKDMIEDYFLQSCFYTLAYNEMFETRINQVVIMIAVEKGLLPLVYIKQIDKNLIVSLLERIREYYLKYYND